MRCHRFLAIACLALAACREDAAAPASTAPAKSAAGLPRFPRSVALGDGGSLLVPAEPRRVVPASATAVDLVAALIDAERVAGVPEQALDFSSLGEPGGAWARIPRFYSYLAEPVLALAPDLVLADPWNQPETTQRLREAGLPLFVLPEVRGWEDARALLRLGGELLGAERRAEELLADLDARVERLRAGAGKRGGVRALCYSNFGGTGWTAGTGTTVHAMMELVGLENVAAEGGREGHYMLGFEALLAHDPELILTSRPLREGSGPAGDRGGASRELLLSEPSLRSLAAVREGGILALPARFFATGSHELVAAAEALALEVDGWLARKGGAEAAPR
jgi:iron complex transport system substrate-binding protein